MCEEYNGWTNRFTWLVNLWLDNEPYTSEELSRIANAGHYDFEFEKDNDLQAWVEDLVLQETGENTSGMSWDLLSSALAWVNWTEIIEAHKEELETA